MRPTRITQTGPGTSSAVVLDIYDRSQVSVAVAVSGTVDYTIQQTMDNVFDTSITPVWTDVPDPNLVGSTTTQTSGLPYTPFALRVVVNSGSGSATMSVLSGSFD